MTRHKTFTTAAARRAADPIVWTIDDVQVRLRPMVDITELGKIAEELQSDVDQSPIAEMSRRRQLMIHLIAMCVVTDDRDDFHALSENLDVTILVEMVQEVIGEYSGAANPTKADLSSDGSSATGGSSTDGAAVVELTSAS